MDHCYGSAIAGLIVPMLSFFCDLDLARADTVYFGGDILTMAGDQPAYVEALAVKDGKISFAGTKADALAAAGSSPIEVDLGGKTLLPGFIDGHGHLPDYALTWTAPDLSPPPVSDAESIPVILAKLRKYIADTHPSRDQLVLAQGYDDSLLEEKRHPTRAELDTVSTENPVVIIHASGHLAVANSVALAKIGYTKETPDPPGGLIRRDPSTGELTGVLEEKAAYPILPIVSRPTPDEQLRRLDEVQSWYSSFGITTAQDGLSNPGNIALLREANRQNRLILDIVSFPMWTLLSKVITGEQKLEGIEYYPPASISNAGRELESDRPVPTPAAVEGSTKPKLKVGIYEGHFKIGGVKISGDGSPQGKTAYLSKPYNAPPPGQPVDYRAYPVVEQAEMDTWFDAAYKNDVQLLVHTNGDATIDLMLNAVAKAREKYGPKDLRPVAIHAQLARHDQIDTMKSLGVVPSFFTAHTYFWGDWHRKSFGEERAGGISPLAYAYEKDLKFSNHNDSPVVPPDMMTLTWTAVNRLTRSGKVLGPEERVSPYVALKSITDWAAYQYFEESTKGTLETGKRADLVILSANPLKVDPLTIKDIDVIETIKDGKAIYRADELGTKWAPRRPKISIFGR